MDLLVLQVGVGGEEVLVGEADEADVVEDGNTPVVGAQELRVLEAGCDAAAAGRGVLAAVALPDGMHRVRRRAGCEVGEEGRGRRYVAGQSRGSPSQVGTVSAVARVVAGGVAA